MHTALVRSNGNGRLPASIEGNSFTDQIRRVMGDTVTDARLTKIIEKQIELAESGDRKAAEFVLKMCGVQAPSSIVQNNYYYAPDSKERKGLKAKTRLGNRIKQYLLKHGPTKPVVLAVELEAEPEEIEAEFAARPERFRKGPDGWEAIV
jgi:hypothetical protein